GRAGRVTSAGHREQLLARADVARARTQPAVVSPDGGRADFWQYRGDAALLENGPHCRDSQPPANRDALWSDGLVWHRALDRDHADRKYCPGAVRGRYDSSPGGVYPGEKGWSHDGRSHGGVAAPERAGGHLHVADPGVRVLDGARGEF